MAIRGGSGQDWPDDELVDEPRFVASRRLHFLDQPRLLNWLSGLRPDGSLLGRVPWWWPLHGLRINQWGDWGRPLAVLDGYSPSPVGRTARFNLGKGFYRLRVDGKAGTNVIVAPEYRDSSSAGVSVAFMCEPGANLQQIFSISTNILYPFLSALNPRLVFWHMKEVADIGEIGLSNRLYDLEAMWKACLTNGDVVYIGTPYEARDATAEFTPIQNRLIRQAAVRNSRAYIDCMTPYVSYQWMLEHGFLTDHVHPSDACNAFLAEIVWQQLGLFCLRPAPSLAVEDTGHAIRLQWMSATNLVYQVESSPDLVSWTALDTVLGDGHRQTRLLTNAPSARCFFRLNITSPTSTP